MRKKGNGGDEKEEQGQKRQRGRRTGQKNGGSPVIMGCAGLGSTALSAVTTVWGSVCGKGGREGGGGGGGGGGEEGKVT